MRLELAEAFGQGLLAHAAHVVEQLAVAQRAGLQMAHHQGGPPAAHQVRRTFGRVILWSHPHERRESLRGSGRNIFVPGTPLRCSLGCVAMDAHRPEDLPLVFRHLFNAGDVRGLMDHYYAPDATYAPMPGQVVSDADVEPAIAGLVALGHPIEVTVRAVLRSGDTALLIVDHEIAGLGMTGTATDVARRQPDGTWRCIIDNPHGGAREVHLPTDTLRALSGT